jgi:ribosomal protein S18 acetylase RimI-like enzyme
LTIEDIVEVRDLHSEWFPLSYQDSFYDRITKKNVISIGCFIKLDASDQELILGTIMTKVQRGKQEVGEMY